MLSFTQDEKNFVASDCFNITFVGENDIYLENAHPMSDDKLYEFYGSAVPYHFVIENTCDSDATAVINLETLSNDTRLDDMYIETILYNGEKDYKDIIDNKTENKDVYSKKGEKRAYQGTNGEVSLYNYQLTLNPVNQNKVIEDSLTAYKLYEFEFKGKGKREFNLLQYIWQDTPASDEVMEKTFESKITVTTAYKSPVVMNALAGRQCAWAFDCKDTTKLFQKDYIQNTTKIVFQNKMNPPAEYLAEFDESAGKDGSVKAYVVQNEDNTTYTIYFQTNGNFEMTSGFYYFQGFSEVEEIEGLEYVDTSNVTDMRCMFDGMNSLTSLDISHFDTSNVSNMSRIFSNCNSLTNLDLSSFYTSSVIDMSMMFYRMSSLTSLDLGNFDTSKVTNMSDMFNRMSSLTSLDLSNFDTSQVTNMAHMFYGMSSLERLNLSSFDTSKVTDMSGMFCEMSSLTSLDLSSFDTSRVTGMGGMFQNSSFTELDLSNFDTSNVTDMHYMFRGMGSLTSLDLSSFDTSRVTDMTTMFASMKKIASLDLSNFDTSSVTSMHGMFQDSSFAELNLSNFDTGKVTNMYNMFCNLSNLTSLDLSSFDTSNVTNMGYMFANSSNLKSITYGNFFIRKEELDRDRMFNNCPANKPTHPSWDGAFTF